MILKYGSYAHASGEVTLSISQRAAYNETGNRSGYIASWTISGILHGTDAADVRTKLLALEAAYGSDGYDLVLYAADGVTVRHSMLNAGSRAGVKIVSLDYPTGDGAEYVTYRSYTITAEAEYNQDLGIYSISETYTFGGGGQQKIVIPTLYGPPIEQLIRQQTPYICQQQGQAIGVAAYPTVPGPAFPNAEHRERRRISYSRPTKLGRNGNMMYAVTWAYEFESPSQLFALPPG